MKKYSKEYLLARLYWKTHSDIARKDALDKMEIMHSELFSKSNWVDLPEEVKARIVVFVNISNA